MSKKTTKAPEKKSKPELDLKTIAEYVKKEEGYKNHAYLDYPRDGSQRRWTIGVGHLIPQKWQRTPHMYLPWLKEQRGIADTDELLTLLFLEDMQSHIDDVALVICPYLHDLALPQQCAIISMSFQLGGKLLGYKSTRGYLDKKDLAGLAKFILTWKAYRQTPQRFYRNSLLLVASIHDKAQAKEFIKLLFPPTELRLVP